MTYIKIIAVDIKAKIAATNTIPAPVSNLVTNISFQSV